MDVQMPVIDGYRATHLIRHHDPYKTTSGTIPIVAMTASAIQGDREKCMRAGMDDYVAKPVTRKTLERTLDRWALHGRRQHTLPGSESESAAHRWKPPRAASPHEAARAAALLVPRRDEEKEQLGLRVERLARAASDGEGQELTVENLGRLEREGGGDGGHGSDAEAQPSESGADSEGGRGERRVQRPRVTRWPDSQRTITGL
jgi:CheY-like chemotaxis protein